MIVVSIGFNTLNINVNRYYFSYYAYLCLFLNCDNDILNTFSSIKWNHTRNKLKLLNQHWISSRDFCHALIEVKWNLKGIFYDNWIHYKNPTFWVTSPNFFKWILGDVQVTSSATNPCFYVNIDVVLDIFVDIKTWSCCIERHLDII